MRLASKSIPYTQPPPYYKAQAPSTKIVSARKIKRMAPLTDDQPYVTIAVENAIEVKNFTLG